MKFNQNASEKLHHETFFKIMNSSPFIRFNAGLSNAPTVLDSECGIYTGKCVPIPRISPYSISRIVLTVCAIEY